jgi:AraC-like DNA-binding protein
MLAASAELAEAPDLALRVVRGLRDRGCCSWLPHVPSEIDTVAAGVEQLCATWRHCDDGTRLTLTIEDECAVLRLTAGQGGAAPSELPLGLLLCAVGAFLGPDWRPESCAFARSHPGEGVCFSELFGDVAFDQDHDSMRFPAADLLRLLPQQGAQPPAAVDRPSTPPAVDPSRPSAEVVRVVILELLPGGACSIQAIGRRLGVDRRTIHRRLAVEGQTFSGLVQSVREAAVAEGLAAHEGRFGVLAQLLGFTGRSTFSRWFRKTYGMTPSRRLTTLRQADMCGAGDSASCMQR